MNSLHYPVICYVNTLMGLYLSQNYEVIPLFITRAFERIILLKTNNSIVYGEGVTYYQMVMEYLALMAQFIVSLDQIDDSSKAIFPQAC